MNDWQRGGESWGRRGHIWKEKRNRIPEEKVFGEENTYSKGEVLQKRSEKGGLWGRARGSVELAAQEKIAEDDIFLEGALGQALLDWVKTAWGEKENFLMDGRKGRKVLC